jgi:hypothetical protein
MEVYDCNDPPVVAVDIVVSKHAGCTFDLYALQYHISPRSEGHVFDWSHKRTHSFLPVASNGDTSVRQKFIVFIEHVIPNFTRPNKQKVKFPSIWDVKTTEKEWRRTLQTSKLASRITHKVLKVGKLAKVNKNTEIRFAWKNDGNFIYKRHRQV